MVTELTVVIVFNDPGLVSLCPIQQGQATRQAKCTPHRALVGRCHYCEPSLASLTLPLLYVHSLLVDGDRMQHQPRLFQKLAGMEVTRIFEPT